MLKKFLFVPVSFLFAVNFACSTTETPNGNVNAVSNTNMPPEFSASPIPMTNMPPGIPDPNLANANSLPKGTTPIPGIPDAKNLNKPLPKGPTPIPGIPDSVIQNKQMNNSMNSNSKNKPIPPQTESDSPNDSTNKPPATRKP
ncbi:MAG: hypothetical protein ACR2MG_00015 [Pyrinomonadaceae bacterium]